MWCCNATLLMLCHATALTASSLAYILAFSALARAVATGHQCTISDAPHNILTATNIAARKYLLLLELHLSHGKRHIDQNKSALRAFVFFAFTSVAAAVP